MKKEKERRHTNPNSILINNLGSRTYRILKDKVKTSSTKHLFGIDIELYGKWIEYQTTAPKMLCINVHIDHVKSIVFFYLSEDEKLREAKNWKNTQPLSKEVNLQRSKNPKLLDHQWQFY